MSTLATMEFLRAHVTSLHVYDADTNRFLCGRLVPLDAQLAVRRNEGPTVEDVAKGAEWLRGWKLCKACARKTAAIAKARGE